MARSKNIAAKKVHRSARQIASVGVRGLGTLINTATVLAGGGIGLLIGDRITERLRTTVVQVIGLATLAIGLANALDTRNIVFPLVGMVLGSIIGELLNVEGRLESIGRMLRNRFARSDTEHKFVEGFVTATLLFCVGPLTILGAIEDASGRTPQLYIIKGTLDGFMTVIFTAVYGIGAIFAAVSVFVVQGSLTTFWHRNRLDTHRPDANRIVCRWRNCGDGNRAQFAGNQKNPSRFVAPWTRHHSAIGMDLRRAWRTPALDRSAALCVADSYPRQVLPKWRRHLKLWFGPLMFHPTTTLPLPPLSTASCYATRNELSKISHRGLVPVWAKDRSRAASLINARSETIDEKASFRGLLKRHRCIVPLTGYYEWKLVEGSGSTKAFKQPYYFTPTQSELFAVAGLWTTWREPGSAPDAPELHSCVLITTEANKTAAKIHNRMPVLLDSDGIEEWISDDEAAPLHLLRPSANKFLRVSKVGTAVNSTRNRGPQLIESIDDGAAPSESETLF